MGCLFISRDEGEVELKMTRLMSGLSFVSVGKYAC